MARPFAGAPYREAVPQASLPERCAAPYSGVEALAWFVAFAAAFVRLLLGLVEPQLDAGDTCLACLAFALTLLGFAFRSRP